MVPVNLVHSIGCDVVLLFPIFVIGTSDPFHIVVIVFQFAHELVHQESG